MSLQQIPLLFKSGRMGFHYLALRALIREAVIMSVFKLHTFNELIWKHFLEELLFVLVSKYHKDRTCACLVHPKF